MSKRIQIVNKLVSLVKGINGTGLYSTNLYNNVERGLKFWDEVNDFPCVFITAGDETREYQPSAFKWGYLAVPIKIYVNTDDPATELENIMTDIETIIDNNATFEYVTGNTIEDMQIISIATDQELLKPIGVGELVLQIQYEV